MTAEHIAKQLHGRKSGVGWMARCPAHNDNNPSLSLTDADGKVLVHCHAGCEQRAVVDALRALGLWPEDEKRSVIVATYDYTDESGGLLYQVVRFDPKDFRPRYPDGYRGWIWKKHPRQVLYHLPEILAQTVTVVGKADVLKY
jgi:hypothetical protein